MGTTCNAQDRNCSIGQRGFVECDGQYTLCNPACPGASCTEGDGRSVPAGGGCGAYQEYTQFQKCINGQWVNQGSPFCGPSAVCF